MVGEEATDVMEPAVQKHSQRRGVSAGSVGWGCGGSSVAVAGQKRIENRPVALPVIPADVADITEHGTISFPDPRTVLITIDCPELCAAGRPDECADGGTIGLC